MHAQSASAAAGSAAPKRTSARSAGPQRRPRSQIASIAVLVNACIVAARRD
jgi:hypothetical protein